MAKRETFYLECTDLFGGELNYCFLGRYAVKASTEKGAARIMAREISLGSGWRFDGFKWVSPSGCTAFYFVDDWDMTESDKARYVPVNF